MPNRRRASASVPVSAPKVKTLSLTLDAFRAANRSYGVCAWRRFYAGASPEDRVALDAALSDDTIEASAIWTVLKAQRKYPGGVDSIRRHRRGECQCPR